MSADFLASDITFEADSPNTKLSLANMAKMPEPVNWTLHDYYSTACDKIFVPIQNSDNLKRINLVSSDDLWDNEMPMFTSDDQKPLANKIAGDCSSLVFLLANLPPKRATEPMAAGTDLPLDAQAEVRASLCGALAAVDNHIQGNHTFRQERCAMRSKNTAADLCSWKDAVFQETFPDTDYMQAPVSHLPKAKSTDGNIFPVGDSSLTDLNAPHYGSSVVMHDDCHVAPPDVTVIYPLVLDAYETDGSSTTTSYDQPSIKYSTPSISLYRMQGNKSKPWKGAFHKLYKHVAAPFAKPISSKTALGAQVMVSPQSPPKRHRMANLFRLR